MKRAIPRTVDRADRVAAAVRTLLDRCEHEFNVPYGSDTWPAGLSDITFAMLLGRVGVRWRYAPLPGLCELVWPAVCGIHVLHVDRCQTLVQKRFAARHGLGHILAGHVANVAYSHDGHAWQGERETVADLFAMMDMFHDDLLAERRRAGYDDEEMERWLCWELARYSDTWPLDRIRDRARLRLRV